MQVFAFLQEIINVFYAGHLGDPAKVAGVGMANVYINMVGQAVILGVNGAIPTLVS